MRTKFWKEIRTRQQKRKKGVFRVTVDNILADDVIRFEFCLLNPNVTTFLYQLDVWGEGYEVIAHGETYDQDLGFPLSWDTLAGGQVFLYGEFRIEGDPARPKQFIYTPGNDEFLRIDLLQGFRDEIRRTYSRILGRS